MNFGFLDFLFLAFGAALIFICAKRGLILTLIKFFKLFLSMGAAYLWGGALARFISEKMLYSPIRNSIYKKVNDIYLDATEGFTAESSMDVIPKFLRTDAMTEKLNGLEESGEALVDSVSDTVAGAISSVVSGIIGFVLVFALTFVALTVIYILVKRFKSIFKTFGRLDTVGGGILGLVFAWLVLLFAGSVVKFFFGERPVYTDSSVVKFFGDSSLQDALKMLDFNEFLKNLWT